jgi:hypothetical protein
LIADCPRRCSAGILTASCPQRRARRPPDSRRDRGATVESIDERSISVWNATRSRSTTRESKPSRSDSSSTASTAKTNQSAPAKKKWLRITAISYEPFPDSPRLLAARNSKLPSLLEARGSQREATNAPRPPQPSRLPDSPRSRAPQRPQWKVSSADPQSWRGRLPR